MKMRNKVFSGMLVTVMVGASVAGAATSNTQSFLQGSSNGIGQGMRTQGQGLQNFGQMKKRPGMRISGIENLSDEAKEQLKAAHVARNPELVREILEANGIELPERPDKPELSDEVKEQIRVAKEAGDMDRVKEILEENGIEFHPKRPGQHKPGQNPQFEKLSDEVKEQLKAAHEAGDMDRVKAILKENGVVRPMGRPGHMPGQQFLETQKLSDAVKEQLKAAHEAGNMDRVKEILKENGIEHLMKKPGQMNPGQRFPQMQNLSDEVRAQLKAAHEAGDRELARKILEENGAKMPVNNGSKFGQRGQDNRSFGQQQGQRGPITEVK